MRRTETQKQINDVDWFLDLVAKLNVQLLSPLPLIVFKVKVTSVATELKAMNTNRR